LTNERPSFILESPVGHGELEIAKHLLKTLGDKTMCRTDWTVLTRITSTRFHRSLRFLLAKGYVEKVGRGVYKMSEKGRRFLEVV
jgi:predicted transcriptional regulator